MVLNKIITFLMMTLMSSVGSVSDAALQAKACLFSMSRFCHKQLIF